MPGTLDPVTHAPIYDATLDPNNGTLMCTSSGSCDTGYTCSAQGTCVVPLRGAIGLGINHDGETWWGSGNCDESCQRWVSACVLARTNAYGVHVDISMRAPANAPQAIKDALAVSDLERNGDATHVAYSLREGAFYGNIFATTPVNPAAPTGIGTETETGAIAGTPSFYACAGPGSNIPEITKRFCSSQGDQVVINVPGVCRQTTTEAGTCAGEDTDPMSPTFGAIQDCYTNAATQPRAQCSDYRDPACYNEVITVYLKTPIAVCGNAVCEPPAEDTTSCPSDCHPSGWAKSFDVNFGAASPVYFDFQGTSAVDARDGTIVLAGLDLHNSDVSLGGDVLPASAGNVVVAKYASDGTYIWGTRFKMAAARVHIAVAGDGSIAIAGWLSDALVGLAKLTTDGRIVTGWPVALGGTAASSSAGGWLAADSAGNLFLAGTYHGTATFATTPPTSFTSTADQVGIGDLFVVKVLPDGTPAWAASIGNVGADSPTSLALDPSGDLLLAADLGESTSHAATSDLFKLSTSLGAVTLLKASPPRDPYLGLSAPQMVFFRAVAADDAGELYATGAFRGSYDFGCGTATATAREFFLVKYSPDGSQCQWVARATTQCPADANYCTGLFEGGTLAFDQKGNVLVGGALDALNAPPFYTPHPVRGAVVDFGAGPFNTYKYPNVFVASYGFDGEFLWAKHIPIVLQGNLRGMSLDNQGSIVLSGTYTGSMQVDDRLLVNTIPEGLGNDYANTYLASFVGPSPLDTTPPAIGTGADQTGSQVNTVPQNIVAQATSLAGAVVFFMPPTAIDTGNAGTSVACSPPPNTTFPIGTTTVTCSAADPLGNHSSATFTVTVVDTIGPVFAPADDVTVPASGASGATVTYTPPMANDQVNGPSSQITCTPPSGRLFGVGKTTVTCSARDNSQNPSQTTFSVIVQRGGDTTAPSITVPAPMTVEATSPSGAIVTYSASATDDVSLATFECSPASGSIFPLGTRTVTCTASDAAGNSARQAFNVTVIDTTRPTLTLPGPIAATATSARGAVVTYSASAADTVDGPLTPTCTTASGATFSLGTTSVSCKATDAHGNVATGSFQAQVSYAWSGFLPPIDPAGNSLFQLGCTVPVKFRLVGASAGITNAVAKLTFTKLSSTYTGSHVAAGSNASATPGNTFRYDSGQYAFNLSTKNLSAGTWKLSIDLGDGVSRTVSISLRK
jgi:hypothetical protein